MWRSVSSRRGIVRAGCLGVGRRALNLSEAGTRLAMRQGWRGIGWRGTSLRFDQEEWVWGVSYKFEALRLGLEPGARDSSMAARHRGYCSKLGQGVCLPIPWDSAVGRGPEATDRPAFIRQLLDGEQGVSGELCIRWVARRECYKCCTTGRSAPYYL